MGLFDEKNNGLEDFKVFKGKTYEFYKVYHDRRWAKLKGEELKLSGDAEHYRVTEEDDGFVLWIH